MNEHLFEIFVDGGCSLCSREAEWLRRLDQNRGLLKITEIGSQEFTQLGARLTVDDAMRSIHGRTTDDEIIEGVAVFRAAYAAVGYGWLWSWTGWPGLRFLVDQAYRVFARIRYQRRMKQTCPVPMMTDRK